MQPLEPRKPRARKSAKRKRPRKPFSRLSSKKWLTISNGEFTAFTSAAALERHGFNAERVAALAARKFKLNDPAAARPFTAANFLILLALDGEFIHDAGEA